MEIFIDTAHVEEIKDLMETGFVDGVTTNPTLMAKTGRPMVSVLEKICDLVKGPVSAEVVSTDYETMKKEAFYLTEIAPQIVVKLPLTMVGLRVCQELSQKGKSTNVTLCFSSLQGLLAAKAGATYISPFVGRLDDIGQEGTLLIEDLCHIYDQYPFLNTKILFASARHLSHVLEAARHGVDAITLPPALLRKMYDHPLTEKGLDLFVSDWKKTGQTLLP